MTMSPTSATFVVNPDAEIVDYSLCRAGVRASARKIQNCRQDALLASERAGGTKRNSLTSSRNIVRDAEDAKEVSYIKPVRKLRAQFSHSPAQFYGFRAAQSRIP